MTISPRISRTGTAAAVAATAALAVPAGLALGATSASAAPARAGGVTAHAARAATVKIGSTGSGQILETGSGFTLYDFTRDHGDHDSCVSISGCTSVWPPLTVSGRPVAGSGVRASLLGTISIGHGRHQVTYAGHPLYRYSADTSRGSTDYLDFGSFGGTWVGLTAAGHLVR